MRTKILFITTLLPFPPDSGGKIKTYHTLALLSAFSDIDLVCFVDKVNDRHHVREIEKMGIRVECVAENVTFGSDPFRSFRKAARSFFSNDPYVVYKFQSRMAEKKIAQMVSAARYDRIYVDHLPMFQYVRRICSETDIKLVILDQHNVESEIAKRMSKSSQNIFKKVFFWNDYLKLARYETDACARAGAVFAVSDRDRSALVAMTGESSSCFVLPPYVARPESGNFYLRHSHEKVILFLGTISWYPNQDAILWFYKNVFVKYGLGNQGWRLLIVGSDPGPGVLRLARDSSVTVTGRVADIKPYVKDALVSVVPLRIAGGVRIRIIELFSLGIPVISSSMGCEGIPAMHGEHLLIADTPDEIMNAINAVRSDETLRIRLSENSLKFAQNGYVFPAFMSSRYSGFIEGSHVAATCAVAADRS